jgi:predicted membrane chloride channel (bestrophin family)
MHLSSISHGICGGGRGATGATAPVPNVWSVLDRSNVFFLSLLVPVIIWLLISNLAKSIVGLLSYSFIVYICRYKVENECRYHA